MMPKTRIQLISNEEIYLVHQVFELTITFGSHLKASSIFRHQNQLQKFAQAQNQINNSS